MSNIIVALAREITRVEGLLAKLPPEKRAGAEDTIQLARMAMESGVIGNYYESLDDLREITA